MADQALPDWFTPVSPAPEQVAPKQEKLPNWFTPASPAMSAAEPVQQKTESLPDWFTPAEPAPQSVDEMQKEFLRDHPDQANLIQAPVHVFTPEENAAMLKKQQDFDNLLMEMPKAMGKTVEGLISPAQLPLAAVASAAARTNEVLGEITKPGPTTFNDVAEAFLNPQMMKDFRKAGGAPERIQDILSNDMKDGSVVDLISDITKEITPLGKYPSDVLSDDDRVLIGSLAPEGYENAAKAIVDLGINVAFDPLMYTSIASKVAPAARGAAKGLEEALDVESMVKNYNVAKNARAAEGLGAEAEAGKRALFQFKLPGANVPIFSIEGKQIMQGLDEMGAVLESKVPVRPLMQRSGMSGFDAAVPLFELDGALAQRKLDEAQSLIMASAPQDEKLIRYAANVAEHGVEAGNALSVAQGIKLTTDERIAANQLQRSWAAVNELGNKAIVDAGGRDLSAIVNKIPTADEQKKILQSMSKTYGDIPAVIVQDGDKMFDVTFSGGSFSYDFGRALKEEARNAKKLQDSVDGLNRATTGGGFSVTPDAAKARSELSTVVMNSLLEKQYGIKEAFNPNKTEVVLNSLQNKLEVARKLKLLNFTKENYGLAIGEVGDYIKGAQMRVANANANGVAASIEDLRIAKMTPDDFRPISSKVFNQIRPFQLGDETVLLKEQELQYPKAIADRIESRFFAPSKNEFAQGMNWYMKQKSMNMLTSPFRLGKQSVDNFFKLKSLDVPWSDVIDELAISAGGKKDAISNLADKIPTVSETVFSLKDFQDKVKVSAKMLVDPEVNASVNSFYGTLYQASQQGKLDKVLYSNIANKVLSSPKAVVEMMNNNPISKSLRHIGNYSDTLTKRAYFRSLIKNGYSAEEATKMVGDHLMDFSSQTNMVKDLRYALPFASFQLKNLETLVPLLAMKPGVSNIMNPYNGSLKKAIEDYSGWSPQDYQFLQTAVPYYRNPILGPILRGQKTLLENKDKALDMLNQYVAWGLEGDAKKKLNSGLQLSLQLPTNLQAAIDLTDISKADQTFSSPIIVAAGLGLLGYDMYKGESLPSKGTPLEARDRLIETMKTLNPVDFPKVYNKIVMPVIEKAMPDFKARMKQGPISESLAKILKLELGGGALSGTKISDDALKTLTNMKLFGMGNLDKADFTYFMHQMQLMRSTLPQVQRLLKRAALKEGRNGTLRALGGIQTIIKEINQNAKIYQDYKDRVSHLGGYMDEESSQMMGIEMEPDMGAEPNVSAQPTDSAGSQTPTTGE